MHVAAWSSFVAPPKPEWMRHAPCNDAPSDLFYPERGEPGREAKTWCNGGGADDRPVCPFRADCLAYALGNREPAGVWGGFGTADRNRMLRTGHVPPLPGPVAPPVDPRPRPDRKHRRRSDRIGPTLNQQAAAVPSEVAGRVRDQYARGVRVDTVAAWNSLSVAVARRLTRGVPRGLTGEVAA